MQANRPSRQRQVCICAFAKHDPIPTRSAGDECLASASGWYVAILPLRKRFARVISPAPIQNIPDRPRSEMSLRALLTPILDDDRIVRGLDDAEARVLVEWLVGRAEGM